MTASSPPPLSAPAERRVLFTLAAVQFTHVMDFMIMMPLGAILMPAFRIDPERFTYLVAAYSLSAAIFGFLGGFVIDRIERKRALLALYAGFCLATFSCALAPGFHLLLFARVAAGAFGGVASSIVTAIVGDVVPPERRGRGMAIVMSGFPLASVLGVPLGLSLANWFGWHAPFLFLAVLSAAIWLFVARTLPPIHIELADNHPVEQMVEIICHPIHLRCFLLSAVLVFAGGVIIPFMAPSMVANVGLTEAQLPLIYAFGGACTFFTMPWLGRLSDRHDKLHVLAGITVLSVISTFVITNMPAAAVPVALVATTFFFVGMSGRFAPAMAMITNAVEGRFRGGFMSVNSAVQQAASGIANLVAGLLVTSDAAGHLLGYPYAGAAAIVAFLLTLYLAARLRAAAPHAARTPGPLVSLPAK